MLPAQLSVSTLTGIFTAVSLLLAQFTFFKEVNVSTEKVFSNELLETFTEFKRVFYCKEMDFNKLLLTSK